jgi:hypothetical protein
MNGAAETPRRFSYFHALFLSFSSKELYRDVGRNWSGIGFAYLLFLLAVSWVPLVAKVHLGFQQFLRDSAPKLTAQLPAIHISNGQMQTDPPGRHEIKDPETGKVFCIIDAGIKGVPDELPEDGIVLTRTKLIVRQAGQQQTRIQDLTNVKEFSMTRDDAARWLRVFGQWLAVVFYPFALLFSFLYRIVQALVYAAIGTLFAQTAGVSLEYGVLLRLAAVAVTPAVLVDTLRDLAGVPIPYWWLLCFVIAMFYLHFAVRAMAEAPPSAESTPSPPPIA